MRFYPVFIFVFVAACTSPSKKQADDKMKKDSVVAQSIDVSKTELIVDTTAIQFIEEHIVHPRGDTFSLFIPKGFKIKIVASGLKRPRFMEIHSNGDLFLTDMHNLADNSKGSIYKFEVSGEKDSLMLINKVTYLTNLRNPNNVLFHTDKQGKEWLYVALTDKLLRFPYLPGDNQLTTPQQLDTYPDYGLSYRYGGWHLTRTIEFDNKGKLYVSVGSSCNSCVEKENVRASVIQMDEDGGNRKVIVSGLRNAVGLEWANGKLYATNMAADHLGKDKPDDALFEIEEGKNYGWPYFYHWNGNVYADPKYDTVDYKMDSTAIPGAFSYLGAHTAPLGLAWFGEAETSDPALQNYFIVALHGSYTPSIGRGYSLQRVRKNWKPEDFVKGFLDKEGNVHGRPCGIKSAGKDRFYFTDDKFGTIYMVYK